MAIKRFHLRHFALDCLQHALDVRDWAKVAIAKKKITALDTEAAAGLALRSQQPLVENEQPDAFHRASDDFASGETGLFCSFGAGYSAGTVFVRRR